MSETSSSVPDEIADAQVEPDAAAPGGDPAPDEPDTVELVLDEEKLEAWDAVKDDYATEPSTGHPATEDQPTDPTEDQPTDPTEDQPD